METKVSPQNNAAQKNITVDSVTQWQLPILAVLFVAVVFVAIKIVVHRHESRTLFMELQTLEKERDKLSAQWSRLKLEQGTALNQVRVERQARWALDMQMPKASQVKMVREPVKKKTMQEVVKAPKNSKVALSD